MKVIEVFLLLAVSCGAELLFIHVTSAPKHFNLRNALRRSWIGDCASSNECGYRFFIDYALTNQSSLMDLDRRLKQEQTKYSDLVMRDACPYMQDRHPHYVNYSNAHVYNEMEVRQGGAALADYPLRKMYKIDWKVCFLKWAKNNRKTPSYHAFVEDDSFVCTGNLLYQLEKVRKKQQHLSFRTGFKLFDGFDDSSTLMSNDVAAFFADHYLVDNEALNCSHIVASSDPAVAARSNWLSWGNSWRGNLCNWREVLLRESQGRLNVSSPHMDCLQAVQMDLQPSSGEGNQSSPSDTLVFLLKDPSPASRDGTGGAALLRTRPLEVAVATPINTSVLGGDLLQSSVEDDGSDGGRGQDLSGLSFSEVRDRQFFDDANRLLDLPWDFPCHLNRPMVWHDHKAGQLLLRNRAKEGVRARRYRRDKLEHLCETTLIVDKVKEPQQVLHLWRATHSHRRYVDLSPAFLHEDSQGWMRLIEGYEALHGKRAGL